MKYRLDFGTWSSVFAVPTQIVDEHLKLCGATQLKVLLLLLRHSAGMELSALAAAVNLTQGDTQDALNYWIGCGVLASEAEGDSAAVLAPMVQKVPPQHNTAPYIPQALPTPTTPTTTQPLVKTTTAEETEQAARLLRTTTAPPTRPKPLEIQKMVQTDPQLKALLDEAEGALGKLLTSSDISTLASLYDWAGVSADVLLLVIGHCKELGKTNLRYIEKVATSWQEQGIDTAEKADEYMRHTHKTNTQTGLVKDAFGIHGRSLTAKETAFVSQWFNEYGFDISLIRLAYERTVDRTGNVSFPYIGKILASWHEKGVKTPEDATRMDANVSRERTRGDGHSSYNIDEIEARLLSDSPRRD